MIIASDGDDAGRHAALRAYRVVRAFTARSAWAEFPAGQDPADVFQSAGPEGLAAILHDHARPLARLVVDEEIDRRLGTRDSEHESLTTMRATAHLIAELLPEHIAREIMTLTAGRTLRTLTDDLRPFADPAVEKAAALLTADAAYQVAAVADRLGFDYSDVITEVANTVAWQAGSPKRLGVHEPRRDLRRGPLPEPGTAHQLVVSSFPRDPVPIVPGEPLKEPAVVRNVRGTQSLRVAPRHSG